MRTITLSISLTAIAVFTFFDGSTQALADDAKQASASGTSSQAVAPANGSRIANLIRQLGDRDYYARERAQTELAAIGFAAFEALSDATTNEDAEIATRAKYLLKLLRVDWADPDDPPEAKDVLRGYDALSVERRAAAIQALGEKKLLLSLCRAAKYDSSILISKVAAGEILRREAKWERPANALVEKMKKIVAQSKRSGAVWIAAWLDTLDDPREAARRFEEIVKSEEALSKKNSEETGPEIVAMLARFRIAKLKKLGESEAVVQATRQLVDLEKGDPDTLADLMTWLTEQKAWKSFDELCERFALQIRGESRLTYLQAWGYGERGDKEKAEKTAQTAFDMYQGKDRLSLIRHFNAARFLQQRGLHEWTRREYDYVVNRPIDSEGFVVQVRSLFAEYLHDQGDDGQAATTLEGCLKSPMGRRQLNEPYGENKLKATWARMYYFQSCVAEAKNKPDEQKELLEKALTSDPGEIDALIAAYRFPNATADYREKTINRIREKADQLQQTIQASPESAEAYNEYAWLIGNTEGDFDQALAHSKKSMELTSESGGYLDTLASVYFGKGDVEDAVKTQRRAVELDPYSGAIKRNLDKFEKAAAVKAQSNAK